MSLQSTFDCSIFFHQEVAMNKSIMIAMTVFSLILISPLKAEMDKRVVHEYHEFIEIDKKAMLIPEQHTMNVVGLARYIKTFTKTDLEFVRALFVWFSSPTGMNYDYDCALDRIPRPNQSASHALKTKIGVCEAYSNIMIEACRYVNIPAYEVVGTVQNINEKNIIPNKLHMWVMVKIGHSYGLIDPTFGSGFCIANEDTTKVEYVKGLNNAHFFFHPYDDVHLRNANISLLNLRSEQRYDFQRTTFPNTLENAIKKYPGLRKHVDNVIGTSYVFYKRNRKVIDEYEANEKDIDKIVSFNIRNVKGASYTYYPAQYEVIKMYFTGFLLHISREQKDTYKKLMTINFESVNELDFLKKQLCFFVESPELDEALASN